MYIVYIQYVELTPLRLHYTPSSLLYKTRCVPISTPTMYTMFTCTLFTEAQP